jgi:Zinc carboxypeptidase
MHSVGSKLMKVFVLSMTIQTLFSQTSYYFPGNQNLNSSIPSPEQFLGYPIGNHHTRYDKVVEYIQELDRLSDRFTSKIIGYTYEQRPQIVATITSPANHARIEEIRLANLNRARNAGGDDQPLVITLGYNVHGNEPSSTEAAMLTAYYLAASQTEETNQWLNGMVILLDPCYNPDGRDRHTYWANMHQGDPMVSDPLDREHNEVWPGGRTNHYWFDLNRDWFLGVHPESKNRIKLFHEWMPYVMTDHHEMGSTSTFYFDPGKYSSNNPIVPSYLYDVIYPKFGEYFSKAANGIQSLYYTKESYDKLYPGYGSSYVNFYGGAGFLFEQASSRGHIQETTTIPLTFGFTIRNQVTGSLATIRASLAEKASLLKCRREFYSTAAQQAKANPIKAYLFGDASDQTRTQAFVNLLRLHQIDVYDLDNDMTQDGIKYPKGKTYLVPTDQPNYIMVRTVFEKGITYTDSLFYDASTWSLIHAFNLPYSELKGTFTKGGKLLNDLEQKVKTFEKSDYGYLIPQKDYNIYRMIYRLQENEIITLTAFKSFSIMVDGKTEQFSYGTLFIPIQQQLKKPDEIYTILKKIEAECKLDIYPVNTSYSQSGIDLGSNFMRTIKKIKALMLIGQGVAASEAGEVWHLLDQRVGMPITKVELNQLGRVNFNDYTTLVMVNGVYTLDKPIEDKIKTWLNAGGTLITFKSASEWAIREGLSKEKIIPGDTLSPVRANYEDIQNREGAKQLGGSIFEADLDITNPIGFGFSERKISVYKNNRTFLSLSKNPIGTVARYAAKPLIGGYLHPSNEPKIANSAAILCSYEGTGRAILFADDPNFRAIWYGTNKLFLNALFFGPLIISPIGGFGEDND